MAQDLPLPGRDREAQARRIVTACAGIVAGCAVLALAWTLDAGVALSYSPAGGAGHGLLQAAQGTSAFVAKAAVPNATAPSVGVPPVALPSVGVPPVALPNVAVPPVAVPNAAPQPAVQQTLVVLKAGAGSGTVKSVTPGIDCGPTCSQTVNDGTQVTLTATPDAGSSFAGFSGAGCSGPGPCTVAVGAGAMVTATFTATPPPKPPPAAIHPLAVSRLFKVSLPPAATDSVKSSGSVKASVKAGGSVKTSGSVKAGGSVKTSVKASGSVAANGSLAVVKDGSGNGTVTGPEIDCAPTCSHNFKQGAQVTLTATPDAGSRFAGFSGAGCSGTGTCTVVVGDDTMVTATFTAASGELTVVRAGSGSGTVTSTGPGIACGETCSNDFSDDAQVTLTATPAEDSSFAGFSGGGCSGTETCTVTVEAETSVTATFVASETCEATETAQAGETTQATEPDETVQATEPDETDQAGESCETGATTQAGELPFTGYNATGAALLGLTLIGFGFGGRLLTRRFRRAG